MRTRKGRLSCSPRWREVSRRAHSPEKDKNGLYDVNTQVHVQRLETLLESRVKDALPEVFQSCCLEGEHTGLLGRAVEGPEVSRSIIDKIRLGKTVSQSCLFYASAEAHQYRQYETFSS